MKLRFKQEPIKLKLKLEPIQLKFKPNMEHQEHQRPAIKEEIDKVISVPKTSYCSEPTSFKCEDGDSKERIQNGEDILKQKIKYFLHCDNCNKWFNEKSEFQTHIKLIHSGNGRRNNTSKMSKFVPIDKGEDVKFKCSVCEKSFLTGFKMGRHKKVVHKITKDAYCEICQRELFV